MRYKVWRGMIKTGVLEVARMLHSATIVNTQLCCIANELEWQENTGDTDLARLDKAGAGASIRSIAQGFHVDLVLIGAIVSALLAAPAVNDNGTFLEQHNMHGEPTPAHRTVPWNEFHKVNAIHSIS